MDLIPDLGTSGMPWGRAETKKKAEGEIMLKRISRIEFRVDAMTEKANNGVGGAVLPREKLGDTRWGKSTCNTLTGVLFSL